MRFAMFGTGGVGGYFGAHLAHAGEDVVFIARGEHLRAIREKGLRVEKPTGEIIAHSPATDDPAQVGEVDAVIVGVKAWQITEAAKAMQSMIGPQTVIVPLQNGIEAPAQLAAVFGPEHVLGGLCATVSWVEGPGHIKSIGTTHFIKFAELDNTLTGRVQRLRQVFERAEVQVEIPSDISVALWEKFIFIVSCGGLAAVTRVPIGVVRSVPETRSMLKKSMAEILTIARARQISLSDDVVEKSVASIDRLDPNSTSSLQRDIAAGKASELEALTGTVVRLAHELGVSAPLNEFIYHSLLPTELRARGELR